MEGGSYEGRFGPVALILGAQHLNYMVTDQQVDNKVAHQRDEIEGNLGLGFRFTPWGTEEMVGLGYQARYLTNRTEDPSSGAVIAPPAGVSSILTAPSQLLHGPTVFGRLDLPLFGPLGLKAQGGVAPIMFGAGSQSAQDLSGMLGWWAVPSLYLRFGALELSGGYALYNYSATNYTYSRSGPQGRVEWRF
jgi:hypothetical protein